MGTVQQRCISHQTCSPCWTWTRLLHARILALQLMPRWLRFSLVAGTCLSQPVILMITMDDGRLIKGCESCLTGSGKMDCPKLVIHFIDTSCSIIFTNKKQYSIHRGLDQFHWPSVSCEVPWPGRDDPLGEATDEPTWSNDDVVFLLTLLRDCRIFHSIIYIYIHTNIMIVVFF